MKAHVSEKKKKELILIKGLIEEYPVTGIMDMTNLPSVQLQKLRAKLRDILLVRLTKKRLIKIALEQLKEKKKNIEKLEDTFADCVPALIFTKESPFKLSKLLNQNKSSAPAKAGQIAPKEIIIPAGPTKFTPGPVIGELGQLGIKTSVEGGKIAITEDLPLVKQGEVISDKAADLLLKLGIEPMEIGLNLVSLHEKGVIYGRDVLTIDEEKYLNDIRLASNEAFTLAINCGYLTKETTPLVIKKAYLQSKTLAKKIEFSTSDDVKDDLVKVEREALKLKEKIPNYEEKKVESEKPVVEETTPEQPKEEKKVESEKPVVEETTPKKPKEETKEIQKVKEIVQEMTDTKIKEKEIKETKEKEKVPSAFELAEKNKDEKNEQEE